MIIIPNTTKVLKLHISATKPHNLLMFNDVSFMKHVKDCLKNNNIHTIMLDSTKGDRIEPYLNIFSIELNNSITGILYFSSSWIETNDSNIIVTVEL